MGLMWLQFCRSREEIPWSASPLPEFSPPWPQG